MTALFIDPGTSGYVGFALRSDRKHPPHPWVIRNLKGRPADTWADRLAPWLNGTAVEGVRAVIEIPPLRASGDPARDRRQGEIGLALGRQIGRFELFFEQAKVPLELVPNATWYDAMAADAAKRRISTVAPIEERPRVTALPPRPARGGYDVGYAGCGHVWHGTYAQLLNERPPRCPKCETSGTKDNPRKVAAFLYAQARWPEQVAELVERQRVPNAPTRPPWREPGVTDGTDAMAMSIMMEV